MKTTQGWTLCVCLAMVGLRAVGQEGVPPVVAPPVPQRIELHSGDVFIGPIVRQDETQVVIAHPLAGELTVPRDRIKQVTQVTAPSAAPAVDPAVVVAAPPAPVAQEPPPGSTTGAPAASPAPPAAAVPPPPKPFGFIGEFLDKWNVQVSFGFDYRDANFESKNYNLGVAANFADEKDRWKLDAKAFYSEYNKQRNREDYHVSLQKDWLIPQQPWFLFAQLEYDRDNFKSWDHRLGTHGGLGYELKDWLGIDARLRGGFGVTREFGGVDPDTRPEGLASSEVTWKINELHTLAGAVHYYPGLDDSDNYRVRSTGDWTMKLSTELGLKVGVWNEYDATEPPGFEKNDLRLYGALVYSF